MDGETPETLIIFQKFKLDFPDTSRFRHLYTGPVMAPGEAEQGKSRSQTLASDISRKELNLPPPGEVHPKESATDVNPLENSTTVELRKQCLFLLNRFLNIGRESSTVPFFIVVLPLPVVVRGLMAEIYLMVV
ncbi:hypothetical protein AVEN_15901-1 [Araneus ventricosus]|uniref:Uncharacterized protein n=1 Tax=Araneus ventricosus TaxID=182803 RepID=A0A4Y2WHJ9_ARAVE|nr:hypothetical protein AVEN_15901-1 [Araneus ventricosus]